jgi:hypothetical protein
MYAFYWSIPSWCQAIIRKTFRSRNTWSIKARRSNKGEWTFTKFPIINEPFVSTTNTIINMMYEDISGVTAKEGDTINITATTTKPSFYHSRQEITRTDGEWTYYNDSATQVEAVYCPVMHIMFGAPPKTMYISYSV